MKSSKITFLTSIGAGLEYYDYVIYSLMVTFISQQFFPGDNRVATLFVAFFVLAMGNIIRPLGATVLGVLGDKFGRKKVFANTLLWMAAISLLMGLVPSFATWGLVATFIFGTLRVIQGVIFGAELPGALTLLSEHIETKEHGVHIGFMAAAVGLGVSLGSLVIWILTKILSDAEMMAWGFRIPFLLGGALALVGFYIRKNIPETKQFLSLQDSNETISGMVIKDHLGQILNVIGILLFPATLVTLNLVFPVYFTDFYHFDVSDVYLVMTCGYIYSTVMLPVFGWVSDRIGKKTLIIASSGLTIIFSFPVFGLLSVKSVWALFAFVMFFQTVIAIMAASYFVLVPRAFKTVIRSTGTTSSYNTAYTIVALFPLLMNYIYGVLERPQYLAWLYVGLAVLTIISTILFKERYNSD